MDKAQISKYLWIVAVASVVLGILGKYQWVVIIGVSNYNFELVLAGFVLVVILKLLKK